MFHNHRQRAIGVSIVALAMIVSAGFAEAGPERRSRVTSEITGVVTVLQEDDFAGQSSRKAYYVEDAQSGKRYRLRFAGSPDESLRTGSTLTVRGRVADRDLHVQQTQVHPLAKSLLEVSGNRTVVAVVTDFQNGAVACTDTSIGDLLFDGSQSVAGLYAETSYGQLTFDGDANLDGQPDVFRVSISAQTADPCDPYAWAAAADAAAANAGYDLAPYQHRLYVLPSGTQCGWAGLATLGCSAFCRSWVNTCQLPDVYAHELGHNLGLHHASTDDDNDGSVDCEYCDISDFMGIGGVGWRQTNAAHKDQMGWLSPQQAVDITGGDQTLVLTALDVDPGAAGFPQLLRIQTPTSGDPYYLSYRRNAGYDQSLSQSYAGKVNIHRHPGGGPVNTLFIDALSDGEQFADVAAGITLTMLSHDSETATILLGAGCEPAAPTVTVTPVSQNGAPGDERTYSVGVVNNDSLSCNTATFDLAAGLPAGWTGGLSTGTLALDPGDGAGAVLTVTSPLSATDGAHTISVDVTESGVPVHTQSTVATYVVQGQAPDPPFGLDSTLLRGRMLRLEWETQPGSGAAFFRIYRDGVLYDTSVAEYYLDWGIQRGATYDYEVTAVDAAGRESAPSGSIEVIIPSAQAKAATTGADKPPVVPSRQR